MDLSNFPEHQRRIVQRYSNLMGALEREYQISKPGHGENGFKEKVWDRIKSLFTNDSPPAILESGGIDSKIVVELVNHEVSQIESEVLWIYFACANSVAAMWAMDRNDQDRAWDFLCEASIHWGAIAVTNRGQETFSHTVIDDYKSNSAAKAAAASHRKTNAIKDRAYEIMRTEAPWASQGRAIDVLTDRLAKEFGNNCLKNFDATIKEWIKRMPDRLDLIPSLSARLTAPSNPK